MNSSYYEQSSKNEGTDVRPPPPPGRRRIAKRILAILLLALVAAFFVLRFLMPEKYYALEARWNFFRAGVKETQFAHFHGLERDLCDSRPNAATQGCHCLFFIHGTGDSSSTWRRIFVTKASEFPQPVRLIAFDLPGVGKSTIPADVAELQASTIGRRFSEWINQSSCANTTVIGNSFGGWVALWTAIQHVDRQSAYSPKIDRVISLGGTGFKDVKPEDAFLEELKRNPTVPGLKEFQRRAYFQPREYPDSFWEQAVKRARKSHSVDLSEIQKPDQYLDHRKWPKDFPRVEYYWGEADRIVPKEMGERLVKEVPGADLFLFPKCGHLPQKECPESVLRALFSP